MAEQKQTAAQTAATPAVKQESHLAMMKRTVVDMVAAKVESFVKNREIDLPQSYSVGNALKAAWLILQTVEDMNHKPALEVCTKDSIANALLDMTVQGLNPIKKQCAFVVYGNKLVCQKEYFGNMVIAKMVDPRVADFFYEVVYKGDKLKYSIKNGQKTITDHEQELDNIDKAEITGAYAIALEKDGSPLRTDIMTIAEIKQAWKQSRTKPVDDNGNVKADSTHGKFTADMAKKTVVNRLCKAIVNASDDASLLLKRLMAQSEEMADRAAAETEIEGEANAGDVIDITEAKAEQVTIPKTATQEQQPEQEEQPRAAAGGSRGPGF
jgi:recombination protein RecT